ATRTYLRKNPYLSILFLCIIDPTLATSYELLAGLLKKPLPGFNYTGRITETSTLAVGAIAAFISNNPEAILVSSGSSTIITFLLMVLTHGIRNEATEKTFRGTTKRTTSPTTNTETQGSSYNTISNSLLKIMQTAEASSQLAAFMATVKLLIHYCDLNKLPIIIAGQLWLTNTLFTHGLFSKSPQQHIIDDEEANLPATPQPSGNEGAALLTTTPPSYETPERTQPQRKLTFTGAVGSYIPPWLKKWPPAQRGHNFGPARKHDASFSSPLTERQTSIPTSATMPPASILAPPEEKQIASDKSIASDNEENHVQILLLEKWHEHLPQNLIADLEENMLEETIAENVGAMLDEQGKLIANIETPFKCVNGTSLPSDILKSVVTHIRIEHTFCTIDENYKRSKQIMLQMKIVYDRDHQYILALPLNEQFKLQTNCIETMRLQSFEIYSELSLKQQITVELNRLLANEDSINAALTNNTISLQELCQIYKQRCSHAYTQALSLQQDNDGRLNILKLGEQIKAGITKIINSEEFKSSPAGQINEVPKTYDSYANALSDAEKYLELATQILKQLEDNKQQHQEPSQLTIMRNVTLHSPLRAHTVVYNYNPNTKELTRNNQNESSINQESGDTPLPQSI
ncbi:MAG: hypothetical protein KAS93_04985, partial [Gammaproteobacteria bacterium]|nr:hypothetical protein [Gammaproteobacteria bacterium]